MLASFFHPLFRYTLRKSDFRAVNTFSSALGGFPVTGAKIYGYKIECIRISQLLGL